LFNDEFFLIAL